MKKDIVYNEDCAGSNGLIKLESEIADCCVTSPPYYGLRDYGTATWEGGVENCDHSYQKGGINPETSSKQISNTGTTISQYEKECKKCGAMRVDSQIGLEETPEQYVNKMVEVFTEVKRVLKPNATLWLNLGDSYAREGGKTPGIGRHWDGREHNPAGLHDRKPLASEIGYKQKDLIGIPWMVAFALRSAGWYLRQDIIWHKPNPMPESVTDRCTKSHEYIFLLSKSAQYYYDAFSIATDYKEKTLTTFGSEIKGYGDGSGLIFAENRANSMAIRKPKQWKTPDGWDTGNGSHGSFHKNGREKGKKGYEHRGPGDKKLTGHSGNFDAEGNLIGDGKANKKSVWTVTTMPYSEAHFATFPERLIVDCIKAGCPEGGIVLDPFAGAFTTPLVAKKLGRHYIGYELNPEYIKIGEKRMNKELGMFQ